MTQNKVTKRNSRSYNSSSDSFGSNSSKNETDAQLMMIFPDRPVIQSIIVLYGSSLSHNSVYDATPAGIMSLFLNKKYTLSFKRDTNLYD